MFKPGSLCVVVEPETKQADGWWLHKTSGTMRGVTTDPTDWFNIPIHRFYGQVVEYISNRTEIFVFSEQAYAYVSESMIQPVEKEN